MRLTEHSEAEYELQQTRLELDALTVELIETKLELRLCRVYNRDLTSTTTSSITINNDNNNDTTTINNNISFIIAWSSDDISPMIAID